MCVGGSVRNDRELASYGLCDGVAGDLWVSGVHTLAPLAALRSVSGTLAVTRSPELESLAGLERLTAVSRLALVDDAKLSDVRALSRLSSAREVLLLGTPRLRSAGGFSGLRALDRLTLRETGLFSAHGFENLSAVQELRVLDNRALIDIGAFSGLQQSAQVVVANNSRLSAHFGFFDGLQTGTQFEISNNAGLDPAIRTRLTASSMHAGIASR